MLSPTAIAFEIFLVPLAVIIIYHDVRYRRIPNAFVLATLISGLILNLSLGGLQGGLNSLGGLCSRLYPDVHAARLRSDGRGRRKLFAAIGSVIRRSTRASDFCRRRSNRRCAGPGFRCAIGSLRNHHASRAANSRRLITGLADAEIQRPC